MILDELVLYNFGVYRGRQVVDLTPPSNEEPVILIGGMNGGGKTTFLDAMHLVLYGKRAKCSNRGKSAYDDFLADCINRSAPSEEGAAIELAFRHPFEGREQSFRVHRSWYPTEKSVSESVKVHRNGKTDPVISDSWDEFVEEFMPLGVSDLFFFDGEKIARFADIRNASNLLQTAVQTLLGLDIVDQLSTDLVALERRKLTEAQSSNVRERVQRARDEKARIQEQLDEVVNAQAELQTKIDSCEEKLDEVEHKYRREGGELYDQRNEIEAEYDELRARIEALETEMREIAAGCAPLLLVRDRLEVMAEHDEKEQKALRAEILSDTLEERDQQVLDRIEEREGQSELYASMQEMLAADRAELTEEKQVDRYLKLDEHARHQFQVLLRSQLDETKEHIREVSVQMDTLREEEVAIERRLAAIPEEEAIIELVEKRNDLREKLSKLRAEKEELDKEREATSERFVEAEEALERRYADMAKSDFAKENTERLVDHAEKVRDTLGDFRGAIIDRHINRIADLVLDSFQKLLRKKGLVTDLEIDGDDFRLQLWDGDENTIAADRLSAGERQLLAVSLLWGLARASGRPLPTVIDTPLGRLDSSHRGHLVERYFPWASHQVILLSTDEEIGPRYYDRLKPAIGREYTLAFDDEENATRVEEGYNLIGDRHVA